MSHKQDRIRASQGIIFRDGKLVNRVEWELERTSRKEQQQGVDTFVEQELAKLDSNA